MKSQPTDHLSEAQKAEDAARKLPERCAPNHTRGPLNVGERPNTVVDEHGTIIANCEFSDSRKKRRKPTGKQSIANARLFSTAPGLFNVVKWVIKHESECLGDYPEILDAARALVARAEDAATPGATQERES